MRYIPDYAKGKRNPDAIRYPDPRLRPISETTYGCVIYQEQLMEIAKQMAGFSPAEADDLRKAVGKKKRDLMATMKEKFLEGMAASNTDPRVAKDLWSLMEAAADYSFNRSHAACYALISYRTAWLRANYPAEYMAALISTVMSTKDKVPFFVNRCDEMGIEVLPPDVNTSDHGFVVSGKSIRFGLDAVKNVGHVAVQAILDARAKDGDFTSLWDFCERVDSRVVNKRAVECLVKCGAFDSTGASRKGMLEALPAATAFGQKAQEDSRLGQSSIFDLGGRSGGVRARPASPCADPRGGVRPARAAQTREGDARHLPLLPSARRGQGRAPGARRLHALEPRREARRLMGDGRRHRHGVQAPHLQERLEDGLRDPRRRRGAGRDARHGEGLRGLAASSWWPTRSWWRGVDSTTRAAARPSWSPRSSSSSSRPRTRSPRRGQRGTRDRFACTSTPVRSAFR